MPGTHSLLTSSPVSGGSGRQHRVIPYGRWCNSAPRTWNWFPSHTHL